MGGPKREIPREEIRARYECQSGQKPISIKDLADEYSTTPGYLYKLSSQGGWDKGKYAEDIKKKVEEDLIEDSKQKQRELRDVYNSALNYIFEKIEEILHEDERNLNEARYFNKLVNTISKLREEHWEVNNIKEVNSLIRQEFKSLNAKDNSLQLNINDFEEYLDEKDSDELLDMAEQEAEVLAKKQQDE